jgi:hypothetical protein
MLGAFMLVLTGMPLQLLHVDLVKSAYATIHTGGSDEWEYSGQHGRSNENFVSHLPGDSSDEWEYSGQHGDSNWDFLSDLQGGDNYRGEGNYQYNILGWSNGQGNSWDNSWDNGWGNGWGNGWDNGWEKDGRCHKKVPEPGTLSLLGAGIAGVGIYSFVRRRNHK